MYLILLRHAEKDLGGGADPGLSPWGAMQAETLAPQLGNADLWPTPARVVSSPKQRAMQTISPLARELELDPEVLAELDERRGDESSADFRQRVRDLMSALEANPVKCVVWCSHLDWIEEFRHVVDCESDLAMPPYDQWSPSQFLVLHLDDDLWRVVSFGRAT